MSKVLATILAFVIFFPVLVLSQEPQPTPQQMAMKKLEFMVGEWEGKSVVMGPDGKKLMAEGTETVQSKQGGSLLLIEGIFKAQIPGNAQPVTVHNALAMVHFDAKTNSYRMHSFRGGDYRPADVKLSNKQFQWGFTDKGTQIRFTMNLTDKGEWHEVGEFSRDGQRWQKFMDMTLKRKVTR